MAKRDPGDIERRIRAAAVERAEIPSYRPMIGDLMALFDASRSTVDEWFDSGARIAGRRIEIRYWLSPGGYRLAHPGDVLQVLEETRKLRSASRPEGVDPEVPSECPTCGQALPAA